MLRTDRRTVVDCRWLGYSGVGRVSTLLLEGLRDLAPSGDWILWGPCAASEYVWPSARWLPDDRSPLAMLGQRAALRPPRADRTLHPHLVRPLAPPHRSVVIAHDTIPVRWAEPRWQRPLQRAFYSWSARGADRVIVYSKSTAGAVVRDLRVRKSQLRLVRLPIDLGMAARAIDRRRFEARGPGDVLYVGIDRPHKNLRRAILAFNGSSPHRAGRRFLLVGLQPDRVFAIREMADRCGVQGVVPMGRCSDAELEGHLAGASVAVQPALEEGLGLTVIEGLAAGLRVCCPRGTAQEEAALGFADLFDGTSVASMRQAIDRAWNAGWRSGAEVKAYLEAAQIPKPIEFASAIVAVLDEVQ